MDSKINFPQVEIHYCTKCQIYSGGTLARTGIIDDISGRIGGLVLVPASGGKFTVLSDGEILFSRQ